MEKKTEKHTIAKKRASTRYYRESTRGRVGVGLPDLGQGSSPRTGLIKKEMQHNYWRMLCQQTQLGFEALGGLLEGSGVTERAVEGKTEDCRFSWCVRYARQHFPKGRNISIGKEKHSRHGHCSMTRVGGGVQFDSSKYRYQSINQLSIRYYIIQLMGLGQSIPILRKETFLET